MIRRRRLVAQRTAGSLTYQHCLLYPPTSSLFFSLALFFILFLSSAHTHTLYTLLEKQMGGVLKKNKQKQNKGGNVLQGEKETIEEG